MCVALNTRTLIGASVTAPIGRTERSWIARRTIDTVALMIAQGRMCPARPAAADRAEPRVGEPPESRSFAARISADWKKIVM